MINGKGVACRKRFNVYPASGYQDLGNEHRVLAVPDEPKPAGPASILRVGTPEGSAVVLGVGLRQAVRRSEFGKRGLSLRKLWGR